MIKIAIILYNIFYNLPVWIWITIPECHRHLFPTIIKRLHMMIIGHLVGWCVCTRMLFLLFKINHQYY